LVRGLCSTSQLSYISTLEVEYHWEDKTALERIGQPPSNAEAKKMKSLTFQTHRCDNFSDISGKGLLYVSKL